MVFECFMLAALLQLLVLNGNCYEIWGRRCIVLLSQNLGRPSNGETSDDRGHEGFEIERISPLSTLNDRRQRHDNPCELNESR